MRVSDEFPSKYLKADDLRGQEVRVTIARVDREKLGEDFKLVVYFRGKDKGVVLNKTNAYAISTAYGDETDDWFGNDIILFSVMTEYGGKTAPAIRVRAPTARDNRSAAPMGSSARRADDPISSGPTGAHPVNEDIPF